jgi:hypothetical protein
VSINNESIFVTKRVNFTRKKRKKEAHTQEKQQALHKFYALKIYLT